MPGFRNVISTLTHDGQEVMGPDILLWHYPNNDILNGSLLTVESNHFCVLKSRGAILNVYETGQFPVQTPDHPIIGSIQQAFFGGLRPGWASIDGGNDEFPLFRDTSRSSRSTFA